MKLHQRKQILYRKIHHTFKIMGLWSQLMKDNDL